MGLHVVNPHVRCGLSIATLTLILITLASTVGGSAPDSPALESLADGPPIVLRGTAVSGDLSTGEERLFALALPATAYFRVSIKKGDFQLSAQVISPTHHLYFEQVSHAFGPLSLSCVIDAEPFVYLRVSSLENSPMPRHFELEVEEVRAANALDQEDAAAAQEFAEAETLRANWNQESIRQAINSYSKALGRWNQLRSLARQVATLNRIAECYFILSDYPQALRTYQQAVTVTRRMGDQALAMQTLNSEGYVHIYMGDNAQGLRDFERVLKYLNSRRETETGAPEPLRADVLNNKGEAYYSLSERRQALSYFNAALAAHETQTNRPADALAHLNLGYTYADLGDIQKAQSNYDQSLTLYRDVKDLRGQALALTAIGGLYSQLGEKQLALNYHRQALETFQTLGNHQGEAASWNGIGQVYEDLNQSQAALESYQSGLQMNERIGNRGFIALGRYYVGRVRQKLGTLDQAFDDYEEAVRLGREVGDRKTVAHGLRGMASIYESRGMKDIALTNYFSVLGLYKQTGDRRWQARTLNRIATLQNAMGHRSTALLNYQESLRLTRAVQDRREEVSTLYNLARLERDHGQITVALGHISAAVELIESNRLKITGEELRTSYFASVHECYELYIDLLMRGNYSKSDAAAAALEVSENARARVLLESLKNKAGGEAPSALEQMLVEERSIWKQLDFRLEAQARLLNGGHNEEDYAAGANEIRKLLASYQAVLDRIKNESPVYASLTQPGVLTTADIKSEARAETVLIEYSLGEERSYLWLVTPEAIEGYPLPARALIEKTADEVYRLLTERQNEQADDYDAQVQEADAQYWKRAQALSQMLLGPISEKISNKRLIVVCDGALHRIPFDALPFPKQNAELAAGPSSQIATPLMLTTEVVTAPSISVLFALEKGHPDNKPASRLIAVFADPVFSDHDPRTRMSQSHLGSENQSNLHLALRDVSGAVGQEELPRLSSTLHEAEAIARLSSGQDRLISTGLAAKLDNVTDNRLNNFQIIHFATHGVFDDLHPELSGIVLSLVDENGRQRDGYVQLNTIYAMHLNADLVVLSACRSGLGQAMTGEGILSITRGFMYAGARSVVASLWKVNDEATLELMQRFYQAMFIEGQRPSAALRTAKLAMWTQPRWRPPYFWAAFVIEGDYSRTPKLAAVSQGRRRLTVPLAVGATLIIFVFLIVGRWYINR